MHSSSSTTTRPADTHHHCKQRRECSLTEDEKRNQTSLSLLRVGKIASYMTVTLLVCYLVVTVIGLATLSSPDDPIQDPYFTIMEVLILFLMPTMLVSLVLYYYFFVGNTSTAAANILYSILSILNLLASTIVTSCVHVTVLVANRSNLKESLISITSSTTNATTQDYYDDVFSFNWPSIIYALDILAWDWFFAFAMICGWLSLTWTDEERHQRVAGSNLIMPGNDEAGTVQSPTMQQHHDAIVADQRRNLRLQRSVLILFAVSGILSLVGLIAVPLNNIQVRMIGIAGYAVFTIPLFGLIGISMNAKQVRIASTEQDISAYDNTSVE